MAEHDVQLSDLVGEAVIGTDEQHRVVYWNRAATALLGWAAGEAAGRSTFDLLRITFPDHTVDSVLQRLAASGEWMGATICFAKNGHGFVCESHVERLSGPGWRNVRYLVVIRDVSERLRLEEVGSRLTDALRQSETRERGEREQAAHSLANAVAFNESLLQAAPVGFLTYRLTGECRGCNAEAARIIGGTVEAAMRQNFRSLESWKQSGLSRLVDRAIATTRTQSAEMAITTTFGKSIQVMVRATVVRSSEGDVLLIVLADLTDIRRTEQELRILTRAIEQSESAVAITDRAGLIEYVNPTLLATSGYGRDEVMGRNPRILQSGLTPIDVYRDLWATITSGRTWHGEFQNRKKTGEVYWERAVISPVTNEQAEITHFVAVKENITAKKEAEQAAHDAEARFEQAQKMEAVGRLAGGIAHDFNNLLTAILGYAEFALGGAAIAPQTKEDIEEIKKAGERAARLTRQLLAFSRKQRVEPEVLDLNQIVSELTKMVGRILREDIRLNLHLATSLGRVRIDPSHLEQVLMNFVVNARDAMPRGGQLTITTEAVDLDDEFVSSHVGVIPGPHVAMRVTDTGTGIPADVLNRIFEPFFTTKGVGKGTGLGLSTVYGIVRQSGGCVDVQSTPGTGTTMSVFLPCVEQPLSTARSSSAAAVHSRGTETVMVVEDDDSLRVLMERALQSRGYTVVSASDGDQAAAVDARVAGPIDLLLSDVVMPGLSGPDLAQRLVRRRPRMKVLYVSGFAHHMATASGITSRHTGFLEKPFTPEVLAFKVREMLDAPLPHQAAAAG